MIDLHQLKDHLTDDDCAAVAIVYDRREKKYLAMTNGSEQLLAKMMNKAIRENGFIKRAIQANSHLVAPASDTDVFARFNSLFGNPFNL